MQKSRGQARRPKNLAARTPMTFPPTNTATRIAMWADRGKLSVLNETARRVVLPLMNETKSPVTTKPMASVIPAMNERLATKQRPIRPRKRERCLALGPRYLVSGSTVPSAKLGVWEEEREFVV